MRKVASFSSKCFPTPEMPDAVTTEFQFGFDSVGHYLDCPRRKVVVNSVERQESTNKQNQAAWDGTELFCRCWFSGL